jgi:hypothetical protein
MSNEAHESGLKAACSVVSNNPEDDLDVVIEKAIKAYVNASGLVLVPREPSDLMIKKSGIAQTVNAKANRRGIYRDFLRYAPNPFESKQDE